MGLHSPIKNLAGTMLYQVCYSPKLYQAIVTLQ